jgi:glycosyltransferase involved in cell wall biosynthesis
MRIGFIVPHVEVGGVETLLFRLGRFLMARNHEVDMIATEREGVWFAKAQELGIQSISLPVARFASPRAHATAVGALLASRRYDICLLNHARLAQASLGMLPDATVAMPVIHNDTDWIYTVGCSNPGAWNVAIAVSPKVLRTTQKIVGTKPVRLIANGVDLPVQARGNRHAQEGGALRICYAGRIIHRQKGVLLLPEIVAECRRRGMHVSLEIAGDGDDRAELERRITDAGVADCVRFLGVLAPEKTGALLLESDVLLMPSFYEGQGLVLLEAMACACVPIVSALTGVTTEVVENGRDGFTPPPGDPLAFVEALAQLYGRPDRLRQMGEAARSKVQTSYSLDAMGAAYLALFEGAAAGEYPLLTSRRRQHAIDDALFHRKDYLPSWLGRTYDNLRALRRAAVSPSH